MKIVPICAESFGANTYLIVSGRSALVVDPAVSVQAILSACQAEDASLEGILLTHGHFDHILSLDTLRDTLPIPAYIHEADRVMLIDGTKNAFSTFSAPTSTIFPTPIAVSCGSRRFRTRGRGGARIRSIQGSAVFSE